MIQFFSMDQIKCLSKFRKNIQLLLLFHNSEVHNLPNNNKFRLIPENYNSSLTLMVLNFFTADMLEIC